MNPVYEVVSPLGDEGDASTRRRTTAAAAPLETLEGKKIALVWTEFYHGDTALRAFGQHLGERFPGVEFIEMPPGRGRSWGDHPDASIAELAEEEGVDGAIVAAGC